MVPTLAELEEIEYRTTLGDYFVRQSLFNIPPCYSHASKDSAQNIAMKK